MRERSCQPVTVGGDGEELEKMWGGGRAVSCACLLACLSSLSVPTTSTSTTPAVCPAIYLPRRRGRPARPACHVDS